MDGASVRRAFVGEGAAGTDGGALRRHFFVHQAFVEKDAIDALENSLNELGEREKALKASLQSTRPHLPSRAPVPPSEEDMPSTGNRGRGN